MPIKYKSIIINYRYVHYIINIIIIYVNTSTTYIVLS